ncbi:3-keto-disaccharide hydrolase [Spirosoma rhododendri]|uniref:DUF1080 domain-containing protein n=1 Tax=Spirosoma rhododendri TaxID=2728024 RepID=A0A7L5DQN7_9BACT|nr:DUF1080 domain-containing protein [Spirosoma rhododendri]QJD79912.1 DUF1080 domain-containing protein [Spirosoma rhododendri]
MSFRFIGRIACSLLFISLSQLAWTQSLPAGRWTSLFNGKSLAGWDMYLRQPEGTNQPPYGLNNDPLHVFTVADGAIRASGQLWGGISTWHEYDNYHLRLDVRWGTKKWYPSDSTRRDAGLLYHATGPYSFAYNCWLRSSELQIQEGEIGDFFGVGAGSAEFPMQPVTVRGKVLDQYAFDAPLRRNADAVGSGRVYRSGNFERPHGQWNTVELITRGADAVYIINGYVVNRLFNTYRPAIHQQTTRGKIQLQSEGAEVYYRQIQLRPISYASPQSLSLSADKTTLTDLIPDKPQTVRITNRGDAVELVAVELSGPAGDQFRVKLPPFPRRLKRGETLDLLVMLLSDTPGKSVTATLRLETVLGPVPDLTVTLQSR